MVVLVLTPSRLQKRTGLCTKTNEAFHGVFTSNLSWFMFFFTTLITKLILLCFGLQNDKLNWLLSGGELDPSLKVCLEDICCKTVPCWVKYVNNIHTGKNKYLSVLGSLFKWMQNTYFTKICPQKQKWMEKRLLYCWVYVVLEFFIVLFFMFMGLYYDSRGPWTRSI